MSTLEDQVRQLVADVLGLPLATVTLATGPQTVDNWDSVQHLNLVLAAEQGLGIQFDPEDIEKIRSVGDLVRIAQQKTGNR